MRDEGIWGWLFQIKSKLGNLAWNIFILIK